MFVFYQIICSTDKCVFRYRQSNVGRPLPSSDYIRALFRCLNYAQRFDYRALRISGRLGEATKNLIGGREIRICRLSLNFKVRVLLKGVVAHCLLTVSEPHMNSKPLSIICSMLSRGILNIFHVADTCFKCNKTQTRMFLSEREKLLQRKSQEERHKTPFKLPKELEEQRRTRTYTHRTQKT